jgi:hypothetical protein
MNNAQPPVPPYFTVPNVGKIPAHVPYCYASIVSFWSWYQVDAKKLEKYLTGTGLKVATFEGKGLVNFDFMFYAGHGGQQNNFKDSPGVTATTEVELNIVAYPEKDALLVPNGLTAQEFILGEDQTKRYGVYRLYVPCDSIFAIAAGSQLFGEWGKFLANFVYDVPTPNNPDRKTWDFAVYDTANKNPGVQGLIFNAKANLQGCLPIVGNGAAITDFGIMKKNAKDKGRLIASRRNYFAIQETYLPENGAFDFKVTFGKSSNPMRKDMEAIIGKTKPFALQTVISPPVIAEARPYYV